MKIPRRRFPLIAFSLAVCGAAAFVCPAGAQNQITFRHGAGGGHFVRGHRAGRFFAGSPLGAYFYPDYDAEPSIAEAPPIEILESAPPAPAPARTPPEGLVLELQGDHWVRITNHGQSQVDEESRPVLPGAAAHKAETPESSTPLPDAVLVYRDGHKEEIGKYVIMGGAIYTSTNDWSNGSPQEQKIPIAALNVPETLKLNRQRGARFSLPSAPNEVMMRP